MRVIKMRYRPEHGTEGIYTVNNAAETAHHFKGFCVERGKVESYRKSRVIEYLEQSERHLTAPYAPSPFERKKTIKPIEILFTGFSKSERERLEAAARKAGMKVRTTITLGLDFLCCGPNKGWSKIEQAEQVGSYFLTEEEFFRLIESGELPATP